MAWLYFYIFVVIGRIFLYNSIRANGRIPRMCSKFIKKGTEIDYEKTAALILDDFRSSKLGLISLETPSEAEK